MSTYKKIHIKSMIKDYELYFTDNICESLRKYKGLSLFFIVDKKVKLLHAKRIAPFLKKYPHIEIEALESNKTLDKTNGFIKQLIKEGFKKNHILAAIGGGIIQDIVGFVSSILYRGVEWVFYPTTLLAQCDSCIGSKTSINIEEYKNQVGNFYPPSSIFLDTKFLETLSKKEIKSGLGEAIKVHLLDSPKSADYILKKYDEVLLDPAAMREVIFRSLLIKKRIIEKDEFDKGYRNIMNYGHTFGHALESVTNYAIPHGQAVTVGVDISNHVSLKLGYIKESEYYKMKRAIIKNWPQLNKNNINMKLFFDALSKDKKNVDNKVSMILTKGPGKMFKDSIILDKNIKKILTSYFKK